MPVGGFSNPYYGKMAVSARTAIGEKSYHLEGASVSRRLRMQPVQTMKRTNKDAQSCPMHDQTPAESVERRPVAEGNPEQATAELSGK